MKTRVCDMFGIDLPIFAFSHCRDVVAAVSKAGGLGVLGALAFSPEQLEIELKWIDDNVDGKPYGVDVVMPAKVAELGEGASDPEKMAAQFGEMIPPQHRAWLDQLLAEHDVPELPEEERSAGALVRPPEQSPGPVVVVGERGHVVLVEHLLDKGLVLLGDHVGELIRHALGVEVAGAGVARGHHDVDAVGLAVDMLVDPVQLDLELLG